MKLDGKPHPCLSQVPDQVLGLQGSHSLECMESSEDSTEWSRQRTWERPKLDLFVCYGPGLCPPPACCTWSRFQSAGLRAFGGQLELPGPTEVLCRGGIGRSRQDWQKRITEAGLGGVFYRLESCSWVLFGRRLCAGVWCWHVLFVHLVLAETRRLIAYFRCGWPLRRHE